MKTLSDYTIYCTPEQTKKALELGAPIETFGNKMICREMVEVAKSLGETEDVEQFLNKRHATIIGDSSYRFPTAEEMIGWLEKQDLQIILSVGSCNMWGFDIYNIDLPLRKQNVHHEDCLSFKTRKEATLAAIDEALDYLTKNKK